jgi:hypothetical protein
MQMKNSLLLITKPDRRNAMEGGHLQKQIGYVFKSSL